MITLKLYYLGEVVHEEPVEMEGTFIFEQRQARVLKAQQWIKDRYKQGLFLSPKWEMWLEADSKMNNENFTTYEIELPDKRR